MAILLVFNDETVTQTDNSSGKGRNLFLVGDKNYGYTPLVEFAEDLHDFGT
jgi:hypothetical protein